MNSLMCFSGIEPKYSCDVIILLCTTSQFNFLLERDLNYWSDHKSENMSKLAGMSTWDRLKNLFVIFQNFKNNKHTKQKKIYKY